MFHRQLLFFFYDFSCFVQDGNTLSLLWMWLAAWSRYQIQTPNCVKGEDHVNEIFAFDTKSAGTETQGVVLLFWTASCAKRTRLHMVLSIIHYSSQSQRYFFKEPTKRCTVLLLWLVRLLSRCPSCVLLTFRLVAAVGMTHDDHNAGGTRRNLEFHATRAHVVATLPNKARGTLAKLRPCLRSRIIEHGKSWKEVKKRFPLVAYLILSIHAHF